MGYSRILVTLDGSKFSEVALQHAVKVANPKAHIHLLSVMAENRVSEIAALANAKAEPPSPGDKNWPPARGIENTHSEEARMAYLRKVAEYLVYAEYDITYEVREGNVVDAIVTVGDSGYEVTIMATHGRTGGEKVALGSVTEGVLQRIHTPILVIPAARVAE